MYVPENFNKENAKHNTGIAALKRYYQHKAVIHELPGKNDVGYDLEMSFNSHPDDIYGIEIKTNAGESKGIIYKTFSLEVYADHEKTKLTDWRTSEGLDYLIVFNRYARKAYIYDVEMLRAYAWKHDGKERASGVGVGQWNQTVKRCSWVILVPWACPEAGFIKEIDLAHCW